ncbi:hypothetical protein Dsin_030933 [Dipteronia sinensis]|uniref:Ionotropic glutamate receptor C-terminal domain-containing protein n=1 Tax=Dipteronia sinensis TaxID=43782 RepID=A0AAE0DRV8_9ROSI|nr:hypothetical protein Dsin_030933 [Dipteronia sinensis]
MEIKRIKKQTTLLYFVVVFLSFFAPSFASHGGSSWPEKSATIPRQQLSGNKKLRLVVPQKSGRFSELVNINRNLQTNATIISGFCIDVFRAAIEELDYQVDYEFIPFVNAMGQSNGTYGELIDQIFFQNCDSAVGDVTITANRSLYVDFTLPYTEENYIGYQIGSLITNTEGVISNLNFKNTNLKRFLSPDDYANALSRGSKNGGVSAIIDEIPYIKIFLSSYSADYSMVRSILSTNGFAFVFRKGCPLVPDLSRAIAKLREDGKLNMMENAWFKSSQSTFSTSSDNSDQDSSNNNNVNPLTLDSFRGLFLITGVSSTLALAILYGCWLYKNWHVMKNCSFRDLIRTRFKFMKEYLSKKINHRTGETN